MKPLNIMAWDTATDFCSAAIVRLENNAPETLAAYENANGSPHSKLLPPQMAELLKQAQLKATDLHLLAVGRGPGSFTGLRTGLALAKGLSMGSGVPVMGIPTLETLGAQLLEMEDAAVAAPVVDARHQEIFSALYIKKKQALVLEVEQIKAPQPIAPDKFQLFWKEYAGSKNIIVGGPACALVEEGIKSRSGNVVNKGELAPSAITMARLAGARFQQGLLADNPALPLYVRQPDIRQNSLHF